MTTDSKESKDQPFVVPEGIQVSKKMTLDDEFLQTTSLQTNSVTQNYTIQPASSDAGRDALFDILSSHQPSDDLKIPTGITIPAKTRNAVMHYSEESGFSKGMIINALLAEFFHQNQELNSKVIRGMSIDDSKVSPLTVALEPYLIDTMDELAGRVNLTRSKLAGRILYNMLKTSGYPVDVAD